jgi:hypothetical protein
MIILIRPGRKRQTRDSIFTRSRTPRQRPWSQASRQHPVKDRASSASLIGPKWDRHHHQLPRPPFSGPAVAGTVISKLLQNPPYPTTATGMAAVCAGSAGRAGSSSDGQTILGLSQPTRCVTAVCRAGGNMQGRRLRIRGGCITVVLGLRRGGDVRFLIGEGWR